MDLKVFGLKFEVCPCIFKGDVIAEDEFLHEGAELLGILCKFLLAEAEFGHELSLFTLELHH